MNEVVGLIVGLLLDPAAGVLAQEVSARLVVHEDDEREGHWDEPAVPLDGEHAQHGVGAGAVRKQSGLKRS